MNNKDNLIEKFDYKFPKELIANKPPNVRDLAKLLVYDRESDKVSSTHFNKLEKFIKPGSVMVFNQTKVIQAKLTLKKHTGGLVEILYLGSKGPDWHILANRSLKIGDRLFFGKRCFRVMSKLEKGLLIHPEFRVENAMLYLEKYGQTPLPPYIKTKNKSAKSNYQTIFAKQLGSVAAPTASLHFTKRLLRSLKKHRVKICFITLHVNLGTFAPLTLDQIRLRKLHEETYEIPAKTIKILETAHRKNAPIIAVGTTVVRTLESAFNQKGLCDKPKGTTTLFINENTKIKMVNQLITNFHVPKSSLLMLVSAFVGREKLLSLYNIAIGKKYRLFSFGDGMFVK